MTDEADAIGKIAETTGKGIDAMREAGGFWGALVKPALEERFGILTDNIRHRRWENLLDLRMRAISKIEALGSKARLCEIPMHVGVPLIEAASLQKARTCASAGRT